MSSEPWIWISKVCYFCFLLLRDKTDNVRSSQFEVCGSYRVHTSEHARLLSSQTTLLRANRPSTTLLAKQASGLTFQIDISEAQMFIIDVALYIASYNGSTQVASLLQAFESFNIAVTLPGLKTGLSCCRK